MNATLLEPTSATHVNGTAQTIGRLNGTPSARGNMPQQEKHIQELIEQIETLPDPNARELLQECLHSVLALHGDGLARILQLVKNAGTDGEKVREALMHDKLVRGLLLIHGLHPVSLEARLRGALDKIRPYLQSHGGNVELIACKTMSPGCDCKVPAKAVRRRPSPSNSPSARSSKKPVPISWDLKSKASLPNLNRPRPARAWRRNKL